MIVLFEGIDGVGKSTQIKLLASEFKNAIATKEPGGTRLGERLRQILLNGEFRLSKEAEMFLFLADRAQHASEVLSQHKDRLILSDRGFISGIAYALPSLDEKKLLELNRLALNGLMPDKIVFFEASKELLATRLASRADKDAIEQRGLEYLMQIQKNMANIIANLGIEYLKIDASQNEQSIKEQIIKFIKD